MGRTYTAVIDLVTGDVLSETDPAGNTKSFTHAPNGLIASSTDQTGVTTTYGYTGVDLTSQTVSGGGISLTSNFSYDSFTGDKLTATAPNGYVTTMQYDLKRRLTNVSDPLSSSTVNTYDIWDNLLTTTKGAQQTQMTYSGTNNPLTATNPLLHTSSNVWDLAGRATQSTDAAGGLTEYFYDANGRLASFKKSGVTEEQRTYRPGGNLWTITDSNGNTTTFNQDQWGRLANMVYPDGTTEVWTYDAMGNVLTYTNRGGAVTTMAYDNRNRMVTKAPAGQPTVTFTYDNAGRLLTASTPVVAGNPASGTFTRTYDSIGRLASETNPQGQVVSYQYDNNSNVTRITYPGGYFVTREYDGLNRLTAIKLNGSATAAATFTYDLLGRRITKGYNNGNSVSYGYDLGNNLLTRGMTVSTGTVNWTYTYNQVHQMLTQNVSDLSYLWTPPALGSVAYGAAITETNIRLWEG
ncbi:MAG: RHS repeat protein [Candidatus Competibacteraceae bacterium]|nr:RHS repeat protein [Candidatus Competibacteraceae bacterium]